MPSSTPKCNPPEREVAFVYNDDLTEEERERLFAGDAEEVTIEDAIRQLVQDADAVDVVVITDILVEEECGLRVLIYDEEDVDSDTITVQYDYDDEEE